MRRRRNFSSRAGFTLIELMAVLALSGLSVTFIYYLFIQNSRLYLVQEELSAMHSALRFATTRVELDLQRAGFLTLLGPNDPRRCSMQNLQTTPASNGRFAAVEFFSPTSSNPLLNNCNATNCPEVRQDGNYVAHDRIELMGNYSTAEEYSAEVLHGKPAALLLHRNVMRSMDRETFRRTFFTPGQLLSVRGQTGKIQIVQVNVNPSNLNRVYTKGILPLVDSTKGLHLRGSIACGVAKSVKVAPIMRIRYSVKRDSNYDWRLIRQVLSVDCRTAGANLACTWTPLPDNNTTHPTLEIAANVVDLQFWFVQQTLTGMVNLDPLHTDPTKRTALNDDARHGFPTGATRNLRGVYFRLTVRSEEEDKTYRYIRSTMQRTALDQPIFAFKLDNKTEYAARVRSITKHIQLVNFLTP